MTLHVLRMVVPRKENKADDEVWSAESPHALDHLKTAKNLDEAEAKQNTGPRRGRSP